MSDINLNRHHQEAMKELMDLATDTSIDSDQRAFEMKQLRQLSEVKVPPALPEPAPAPVPPTRREKALARAAKILDNETTRTFIKAAGAFGGVGLVTWSTIRRDHRLEREALNQANQRPS